MGKAAHAQGVLPHGFYRSIHSFFNESRKLGGALPLKFTSGGQTKEPCLRVKRTGDVLQGGVELLDANNMSAGGYPRKEQGGIILCASAYVS